MKDRGSRRASTYLNCVGEPNGKTLAMSLSGAGAYPLVILRSYSRAMRRKASSRTTSAKRAIREPT